MHIVLMVIEAIIFFKIHLRRYLIHKVEARVTVR